MKKVVVDNIPHLCLFATRDITINEELRYDYGLNDLPWRKKVISTTVTTQSKSYQFKIDFLEITYVEVRLTQPSWLAKF